MIAAVREPNPVVVIGNKRMLGEKGAVPEEMYEVPLGSGEIKRPGGDVTVVAIGRMVGEALKAAEQLAGDGIECEVIDPRTLQPFDTRSRGRVRADAPTAPSSSTRRCGSAASAPRSPPRSRSWRSTTSTPRSAGSARRSHRCRSVPGSSGRTSPTPPQWPTPCGPRWAPGTDVPVATVGIIANPNAGKDVRRLVAHATVTSDATKVSIIRRVAIGAVEAGADKIVVMPDRQQLGRRALDGLDVEWTELLTPLTDSRHDSGTAAAAMSQLGVGCLVVLGGDGTCRDVALALAGGSAGAAQHRHEQRLPALGRGDGRRLGRRARRHRGGRPRRRRDPGEGRSASTGPVTPSTSRSSTPPWSTAASPAAGRSGIPTGSGRSW